VTGKHIDTCPHCGSHLTPWKTPPDSSWGGNIHFVCFNDACPYYEKGWAWMLETYEVKASYRFRYDPDNRTSGPLAVWSAAALRDGIVDERDEQEETP